MLLAIDIGNTNVVLGILSGEKVLDQWRLTTSHMKTRDEFWVTVKLLASDAGINIRDIEDVIIGSVVPPLADQFVLMSRKYLNIDPVIVRNTLDLGIKYRVDNPSELGADRICDIVGSIHKYPLPQIIIDLGTATTFDIVNIEKEYLGGSIMPGIETSTKSLIDKAAKLPKVNYIFTESVIGKNTIDHLRAGILWGAVDQIDGMVRRIKKELNWETVSVIATGGLAKIISRHSDTITEVNSNLTLEGLCIIYKQVKSIQ